jgi:hypothetical protein
VLIIQDPKKTLKITDTRKRISLVNLQKKNKIVVQIACYKMSSWKLKMNLMLYSPNNESKPQATHIMKLNPMEPVRINRPDGDTKIPDPENTKETHL